MIFTIFRDFSRFFRFYFRFKNVKNNSKNDKKRLIFRAGPTWMRRGTWGHVEVPRGPTQRLSGVYILISILYTLYIGVFSLP